MIKMNRSPGDLVYGGPMVGWGLGSSEVHGTQENLGPPHHSRTRTLLAAATVQGLG